MGPPSRLMPDLDGPVFEHVPLKFFLVEDNVIIRENLADTLHEMVGAEVVGISEAQGHL